MKKKNKQKIIAGMLTMSVMVQSIIPGIQVDAKGKNARKEKVLRDAAEYALNSNLTMKEAEKGLHKKDKQDDDRDGLSNYWEESIGTDKNNPDTDGDGLTDYEEVVLTGTDPLLADTNGDGISDAEEDSDGDGLTNKQEIKLGTNPLSADTDEDGLTDWEEVKIYKTDPTVYDTDADGASDGFEVEKMNAGKKGFNPRKADKKMKQRLLEETTVKKSARTTQRQPDEIVGSLQVVGSHNTEAAFTEGHSFLVYTSYVDGQSIEIDDLYGSYQFNEKEYAEAVADNEKLLSWRSLVEECTPDNEAERKVVADAMWPHNDKSVKSYTLNKGDYLSIGNFTQNSYFKSFKDGVFNGQSGTLMEMVALQALYQAATGKKVSVMFVMTHLEEVTKLLAFKSYIKDEDVIDGTTDGGIWVNREMYDQRYQYDQYPHEIYQVEITQAEFDKMVETLNSNNYYSMLNHNCSSVASLVWNAAVGYETDKNGNYQTDKRGNRVKSELYISARGKGILSIIDFPGAICESIAAMKNKETARGSYYSENSKIVQGETV